MKLKSSVKTAVVSTLALTSTAAIIYALPNLATQNSKATDIGNRLKLDVEKVDSDTVKVSIDNVQDIPKSLQFSLRLDGNVKLANGESSITDLIKPQVKARLANDEYQEKTNNILTDYTYNEDLNTIDVLITSENSLPKFGNKIEVFELDLKSSNKATKQGGTTYKVVPNNEDEYKYLSVTNKEYDHLGVVYDDKTLSLNTAPTISTSKDFIKVVEGQTIALTPENLGITMKDEDSDQVRLQVKDLSQNNKPIITDFMKETPGLYNLECIAIDSNNESSEPITIPVYVDYDNVTTKPTITRNDEELKSDITIHGGEVFNPLENVKAVDAKGRELEVKVSTDKELNLDPENNTTYVLTYTAVDDYGNETKLNVNLNVIANKAPVISGVKNHTLKVGDSFDPRKDVVVTDEDDNIELVVDSNVNTNIPGEYKVSYSATDSKGKTTRVQSTVTVNPKTSPVTAMPIIVAKDTTIKLGERFNALDLVRVYNTKGEDITSTVDVKVSGDKVNTNKEGSYTITYSVKEKNGETSTKRITVTVVKDATLASKINISKKFNNLYIGASKEISASVNKEADVKSIEWSVSDNNILDLEVKGNIAKITAKAQGRAVVTATTTDGTNISDSFEVTVKDYTTNGIIPDTIMGIIDTNIVIPVCGEGLDNSPVELQVKDVKEDQFEKFVKHLKDFNSKIVDTREEDGFTIYKIKLTKSNIFTRLFRKSAEEYFIELKIDNKLASSKKLKEIVSNTLKNEQNDNSNDDKNQSIGNGPSNNDVTENDKNQSTENESSNNGVTENDENQSTESGSSNNDVTENDENKSTENESSNNDITENPKSGDASILGYIGLGVIASGALFITSRKNRNEK